MRHENPFANSETNQASKYMKNMEHYKPHASRRPDEEKNQNDESGCLTQGQPVNHFIESVEQSLKE